MLKQRHISIIPSAVSRTFDRDCSTIIAFYIERHAHCMINSSPLRLKQQMQIRCIRVLFTQLLLFFLGVCGTLAAPHAPNLSLDIYHQLDNHAVVVDGHLPGTENLNEKALPISRLRAMETSNLPGNNNLAERSQVPQRLPGTANLAEKRIPDVVLKRLQPSDIKWS